MRVLTCQCGLHVYFCSEGQAALSEIVRLPLSLIAIAMPASYAIDYVSDYLWG